MKLQFFSTWLLCLVLQFDKSTLVSAFICNMCIRIENTEIIKQSLLKDTFRKLLNRLHIRKGSSPRDIHTKMIKQKSQEYEKCRKYSAGFKYKPKNSPPLQLNKPEKPLLSFNNTPTQHIQSHSINAWLKKSVNSDRCKTQIAIKTLHSKNKKVSECNSILIAKSFILQEFQPRKTHFNSFMKRLNTQEQDTVLVKRKSCLDNIKTKKKSRHQQTRMFNFRKNLKKAQKKEFQGVNKSNSEEYEPWQTDPNYDNF